VRGLTGGEAGPQGGRRQLRRDTGIKKEKKGLINNLEVKSGNFINMLFA
jgi:hypothetical protein